ncbi:Methyltransferase type 11 (plasmid) [Deinococcus gobiensis I-0]|uniref:Methyltransferase type 11 n=1 Tax=Deinococcus gobiensis (strain DSM 21396 / JCM 16679 / CGMCC 1.7299 / I-0) TaxID=745776 RepID=H8H2X0_DEIGI|nr:Methyltransferase type 11 [Deinococcus gobiensis I-0]
MLDNLDLPAEQWDISYLGNPARELTGPNGQTALVHDLILAVRKRF